MKKLLLILVPLALLVLFPTTASAQNTFSVITGNVAIPNVNIQVLNTQRGTSSDKNGDFILKTLKTDRSIGLLFSCVGYQDTLISVVPQQDTIVIRFKMMETSYMLDPATVTAEKVTYYYSKPNFVMFDFEILDDKFFILQKKTSRNGGYRVLITDMLFEPVDTIFLPKHIVPQKIILDCFNNCQIVTQDSVYQIAKYDNYEIAFPSDKNRYMSLMKNILFVTSKYMYFNELRLDGYISTFYRYNLDTKEKENLFICDDSHSFREIKRDVKFHQYYKTVDPNYRGPNDEEWENFIRHAWYHTKDCRLMQVADTLYYFDHLNKKIEAYDELMNKLHSCIITYPDSKDYWRYTIYQDRVFGTFYTILGTTLHEINIQTGKTTPKTHVNNFFSQKIIIYKGSLYSLKKRTESFTSEIPFIEKTNLK